MLVFDVELVSIPGPGAVAPKVQPADGASGGGRVLTRATAALTGFVGFSLSPLCRSFGVVYDLALVHHPLAVGRGPGVDQSRRRRFQSDQCDINTAAASAEALL